MAIWLHFLCFLWLSLFYDHLLPRNSESQLIATANPCAVYCTFSTDLRSVYFSPTRKVYLIKTPVGSQGTHRLSLTTVMHMVLWDELIQTETTNYSSKICEKARERLIFTSYCYYCDSEITNQLGFVFCFLLSSTFPPTLRYNEQKMCMTSAVPVLISTKW